MSILERFYSDFPKFLPTLTTLAAVLLALWSVNWLLFHRKRELDPESRFPRRIAMLLLTGLGVVLVLLALPVSEDTRDQLFRLLALVLTAVIAFSSTTFVANAMAGMMLRAVGSFRPGDFLSVGEQFGRVTERGLFHTEIQTEDRNLTTIPNLYMISHPTTVVRASGTIVSATVSLGYDNPHPVIEPLLVKAARDARLQDPFVQITDLGNFAVTYRVAGFLPEAKQILTARSNLRKMMLDGLHGAGVEIVSPTFMNQRPLREGATTRPPESHLRSVRAAPAEDQIPEELIFDKAEEAEELEQLRIERDGLVAEIKELQTRLKKADAADRARLERDIEDRRTRCEAIVKMLQNAEDPCAT